MSKSRSMYFEGAFQAGREVSPAKDRARSEAMVMADVRTNIIIRDEFSFITDLSYQLSIRYQRPVSSVVATLQHGACMLFGGTFDPAYVMSVSALPSDIAPTKNRRNAALIQKHMEESLGVASSRGLLRFVAVPEENTARSGKTVAGEIVDSGKKEDADGIMSKEKSRRRLSVKASLNFLPYYKTTTLDIMQSLSSLRPASSNPEPPVSAMDALPPRAPMTRVVEEDESPGASGDAPLPTSEALVVPSKSKHVNRRKSFVASVFRRSSRTQDA
ncbi:Tautomerase/MIF superfamily [Plectosphaerella plurivora]|uniref:L-dopachrome isomerase n=1 Tax=Plectosphaerella plurivora TaxID=936078 RepID=A0A9P8V3F0_9PEZI|nr:Tautomerase/MIF superfamily [Plectosphaerella plurivora]